MGDTYSKMYFHVIFSVKNREHSISKAWKEDLNKYTTGVVNNQEMHHCKKIFEEEYIEFLETCEVDYYKHYVF